VKKVTVESTPNSKVSDYTYLLFTGNVAHFVCKEYLLSKPCKRLKLLN